MEFIDESTNDNGTRHEGLSLVLHSNIHDSNGTKDSLASNRASSFSLVSLDDFPSLILLESLFLSRNPRDLIIPEVTVPSGICVLNDFITFMGRWILDS